MPHSTPNLTTPQPTPPNSNPRLPTYTPEQHKQWFAAKETGDVLLADSMKQERQEGWIRRYEICDKKDNYALLKSIGFDSIDAFGHHLREIHNKDVSKQGCGFSTSNFRKYRSEGRVYKDLFLARIPYSEMPQNSTTGYFLSQYDVKEHKIPVADVWKKALELAGNANRARQEHITEAVTYLTNGLAHQHTAEAQIKKLKEDLEAAEKRRKDELAAAEKLRKDMESKQKAELYLAKKRGLDPEIKDEMERDQSRVKRIKGYLVGYELQDGGYLRDAKHLESDMEKAKNIAKNALTDGIYNNLTTTARLNLAKAFEPYIRCRRQIALSINGNLFTDVDFFSSSEQCMNFLKD